MEYEAIIHYHATIVMQFLDAYSGRAIETPSVSVMRGEDKVPIVVKSGGFAVVLNERDVAQDFLVSIRGYESQQVLTGPTVRWDRPCLIHMIPAVSTSGLQTHLTLEGNMPGITQISGVFLSNYILRFKNYTSKTKKMAIFNRHNKPLSRIRHALISMDESSFIPFSAYPQKSVDEILVEDFQEAELPSINAPIAPLVEGSVTPDGNYLFRVSDDSSKPVYLIRYVVDGIAHFQKVDFYSQEKIILERGDHS